jgi:hypothetical protein
MTWVSLAYMLEVGALERTWVIQFNLILPRSLRLCVHSGPRAIGLFYFHWRHICILIHTFIHMLAFIPTWTGSMLCRELLGYSSGLL